mmetsp:Transcript_15857/g.40824  ORF Transcript_15857/g.40824 Transcript_15857/m.40824 type:complete len:227 (-) Transcript_15857:738-1418(-)
MPREPQQLRDRVHHRPRHQRQPDVRQLLPANQPVVRDRAPDHAQRAPQQHVEHGVLAAGHAPDVGAKHVLVRGHEAVRGVGGRAAGLEARRDVRHKGLLKDGGKQGPVALGHLVPAHRLLQRGGSEHLGGGRLPFGPQKLSSEMVERRHVGRALDEVLKGEEPLAVKRKQLRAGRRGDRRGLGDELHQRNAQQSLCRLGVATTKLLDLLRHGPRLQGLQHPSLGQR